MNELIEGKWYRIENSIFRPSTVVEFEPDLNMGDTCNVGVYCAWFNFKNNWYCDFLQEKFDLPSDRIKPLETLTPKEALILLAHGFELIYFGGWVDTIIKLVDRKIMMKQPKHSGENWSEYQGNTFDSFTIHALPEGE
jgi:hypothetical protein